MNNARAMRGVSLSIQSAPNATALAVAPSASHLVLIPSYNPGALLVETVRAARAHWSPVWIVVDGSTDDSAAAVADMAEHDAGLRVLVLPQNCGKGAAILYGARLARAAGYTHALTMDADGQHPAALIGSFMAASQRHPAALILGEPQFDASAPALRVQGRKICNWCVNVETLWAGIHDSLFGFRVYPLEPLIAIMRYRLWMRRFDFDAESAVRLCWRGLPLHNLPAPVRYLSAANGGVSHFHYWRDNVLLSWMHVRLLAGAVWRLPLLVTRQLLARARPDEG